MISPNDPAFPQRKAIGSDGVFVDESTGGLTIRAHFAAMAMQGMAANSAFAAMSPEQIANYSIEQADAMIDGLNK